MNQRNADLRNKLARVGEAKRALAASDALEHLALPPGERLLVTLQHADAMLRAFPPPAGAEQADLAAWQRVRQRLRRAG